MTDINDIIGRIYGSPQQTVVAVAGAGTQAVAWLFGVAGASRTMLEVLVPYGRLSMIDFVGHEPAQFVSEAAARSMAEAAYKRAVKLNEGESPMVGLACTATIATDRVKRGEHRCHIATWDASGSTSYNLRLDKGRRDRAGEEDLVSRLVVSALAQACGIEDEIDLELSTDDQLVVHHLAHPNPSDTAVVRRYRRRYRPSRWTLESHA